jgi:regulator of protease activity HflC (stomatin/prohibitin superfamily)
MTAGAIALIVIAVFVLIIAITGVRIVPQARAGVVERLGRYTRTLDAGLTLIVPFIDRVKPLIDLREQVVAFPPQPVITEDNLVVGIDTVIYFTVTDAKAVTYEIANPLQAIEQLTVTTLRNVIGGLTLEETLTSRDNINSQLRVVLDEATGKWGIRVNRVELKSSSRRARSRRRWRSRCAPSATAAPRSSPPRAPSSPRSSQPRARSRRRCSRPRAPRPAAILRAEGESKAIETGLRGDPRREPDQLLLSYQYLQMLPQLAQGSANKVFVIPSDFSQALAGITGALGAQTQPEVAPNGAPADRPRKPRRPSGSDEIDAKAAADAADAARAAEAAAAEAAGATSPGSLGAGRIPPELGEGG